MEFFGITLYGPQNFFKDIMREEYKEPTCKEDVDPLMKKVVENSTCPKNIERPDVHVVRLIDCYLGRGNGFAYGSFQRFNRMKRKGLMKPVGPADMYRLPPASSIDEIFISPSCSNASTPRKRQLNEVIKLKKVLSNGKDVRSKSYKHKVEDSRRN